MEVNSTNATEEVKVDWKIKLDKPVAFNNVADIDVTTTKELSKLINDLFAPVFKDYFGCNIKTIYVQDRNAWVISPEIFFHVLKEDAYADDNALFGFRPLSMQPKDDIVGRVQRLSQISVTSGVKVGITDEAKSILEDFVLTPQNKKFDWKEAYNTISTDTETFIRVFKLDIIKLVRKIFGAKDETGARLEYQITPIRPVDLTQQQSYKQIDNWSITILRLNVDNQNVAAELLGFNQPIYDNTPVMVKAHEQPVPKAVNYSSAKVERREDHSVVTEC